MKGYRRYYDGEKYVVDNELSEVQKLPRDSTTSWFRTRQQALTAADLDDFFEKTRTIFPDSEFPEQKNVKICKDCGSYFYQTETEREWFLERNLKAPCRCYTCRKKRKDNTEK